MNQLYIEKAIEFRRYFHENPELGFNEIGTAKYIRNALTNANIKWSECTPTGTIAILGKGDKCIALRADIDALPITEETGLPFSSLNNGVMHACGHDFHVATLLATALFLKDNESELNHTVKLIFQPAEEVQPGGAIKMINEGVLNNPDVNEIFGFHIYPELNTGKLAVSSGYVMAATNELYITINGKAHHAAQPHIGNDAILAAAKIIDFFQTIITKFRNPIEPAVISIASINGESAVNTFPAKVELKGVIRTYNMELKDKLIEKIISGSEAISQLYGCTATVRIVDGYPSLKNSISSVDYVKSIANDVVGEANIKDFEPKMWAEDFARYTEVIPGAFFFLGAIPNDKESLPPLHNPLLSPDEELLNYSVEMMIKLALNYK